jgi:hypothetical protein
MYSGYTIGPYGGTVGVPYLTSAYPAQPSAAGYAIMTQMAEAVINTMSLKLTGGYLQDQTLPWQGDVIPNVNKLTLFHEMQFTPSGQYTGGLVFPLTNTNYFTKTSGTWASSNPLIMYIDQTGHAWALTPGSANITFTSPTGVRLNEWTMTVQSYDQAF